jgi:hypothetical protein
MLHLSFISLGFATDPVSGSGSGDGPAATQRRSVCWVHLIRDLAAIADRPGASAEYGENVQAPLRGRKDCLGPIKGTCCWSGGRQPASA